MCPRINKEIHGELDHSGLTKRALRSSTIDSQSGVDRELPDPPSVLKQMGARSQTRLSFDGAGLRCGYLVPSQEVQARLDQVTIPGIDNAEASSNNAPATETGRQGRRRSRPLAKPLANEVRLRADKSVASPTSSTIPSFAPRVRVRRQENKLSCWCRSWATPTQPAGWHPVKASGASCNGDLTKSGG